MWDVVANQSENFDSFVTPLLSLVWSSCYQKNIGAQYTHIQPSLLKVSRDAPQHWGSASKKFLIFHCSNKLFEWSQRLELFFLTEGRNNFGKNTVYSVLLF